MRKLLPLVFLAFVVSLPAIAQQRQIRIPAVSKPGTEREPVPPALRVSCSRDTLAYPDAKANGLRLLSINTATSAQGLYQYYDAPQDITIYGMDFFGYAPSSANPVQVYCHLYLAGPDSLPMGQPLASDTVPVDSNYGFLTLPDLKRTGNFNIPITLNQPYILAVINPNSQNVSVLTNDWDTNDGGGEWLSGADFRNTPSGRWTRGYNVNVGQVPFDADAYLFPHVSYELEALFSADKACINAGDTVNFTNYSSPVVGHRMYNEHVFNNSNQEWGWNFGDGSAIYFGNNPSHVYAGTGPYTAILYATMLGWSTVCTDNISGQIGGNGFPTARFINNMVGAYANLTDISVGANSWSWDFGDGGTSTLQNPVHQYTANGNFVITLIAGNACGSDTILDTVTVNCDFPVADFGWSRNFFQIVFSDSSQYATSWSWDFGDGSGSSTQQNPSYTYANYGAYEVTLIASSICGTDTLKDSVFITAPVGIEAGQVQSVTLFPNPGRDRISVRAADLKSCAVYDLAGRLLLTESASDGGKALELNVGNLAEGMYLVRIATRKGVVTKRFIKE